MGALRAPALGALFPAFEAQGGLARKGVLRCVEGRRAVVLEKAFSRINALELSFTSRPVENQMHGWAWVIQPYIFVALPTLAPLIRPACFELCSHSTVGAASLERESVLRCLGVSANAWQLRGRFCDGGRFCHGGRCGPTGALVNDDALASQPVAEKEACPYSGSDEAKRPYAAACALGWMMVVVLCHENLSTYGIRNALTIPRIARRVKEQA